MPHPFAPVFDFAPDDRTSRLTPPDRPVMQITLCITAVALVSSGRPSATHNKWAETASIAHPSSGSPDLDGCILRVVNRLQDLPRLGGIPDHVEL